MKCIRRFLNKLRTLRRIGEKRNEIRLIPFSIKEEIVYNSAARYTPVDDSITSLNLKTKNR